MGVSQHRHSTRSHGRPARAASLSYNIVTKLLRKELGYQHLVVTDDLEMGAISRHCTIGDATTRAFLAGSDMMLICARPDVIRAGYHALLQAAESGRVPKNACAPRCAGLRQSRQSSNSLALDLDRVATLAGRLSN